MTTSEKVKNAIEKQGRKKTWLADNLELSRPTLDNRLSNDNWQPEDITRLKSLGLI